MPKAVRFNAFGDIDVLHLSEVPRPVPAPGQALVRVKAAGINPGEISVRAGVFAKRWPSTFPSGQGSDLAGVVEEVGAGVTSVTPGAEVIGFTNARASQAEFVVVPELQLALKPAGVSWQQAGALFVAGTTAYAAVRAVSLRPGETVVVSGAAGGVGSIAVQLARNAGARVIGLASAANHDWLRAHGAVPVAYGDGVADRIRAARAHPDAFIDTFGQGYVKLAIALGIAPDRIETVIDWEAAEKHGVKTDGSHAAATREVLAELAGLIAAGRLEIPIAKTFPLAEVREAYRELAQRHTRGKIVLIP